MKLFRTEQEETETRVFLRVKCSARRRAQDAGRVPGARIASIRSAQIVKPARESAMP